MSRQTEEMSKGAKVAGTVVGLTIVLSTFAALIFAGSLAMEPELLRDFGVSLQPQATSSNTSTTDEHHSSMPISPFTPPVVEQRRSPENISPPASPPIARLTPVTTSPTPTPPTPPPTSPATVTRPTPPTTYRHQHRVLLHRQRECKCLDGEEVLWTLDREGQG
jgi:hypothetical protein